MTGHAEVRPISSPARVPMGTGRRDALHAPNPFMPRASRGYSRLRIDRWNLERGFRSYAEALAAEASPVATCAPICWSIPSLSH